MDRESLLVLAADFVNRAPGNRVAPEVAIRPALAGMPIFEAPLIGVASSSDPLFFKLQQPGIIGPHFSLPDFWLPEAQSVISFFLPFTEVVREGNSMEPYWPSAEWLHARIEGQALLGELTRYLCACLTGRGYQAVAPSLDGRFFSRGKAGSDGIPGFTSNWSERHVAHVAGLGTFSLSKGLITSRGVAGRFGSIVTDLALPSDRRPYEGAEDYCTLCGDCVKNCPVGAISLELGKDHLLCSEFLDAVRDRYSPRYGCGKCQVGVSCEAGIPVCSPLVQQALAVQGKASNGGRRI